MQLADRIFRRTDWRKTSPFGPRRNPVTGKQQHHNGTDYATGGQKWPLHALENGTVIGSGFDNSRGHFVSVNYPRIGRELHHYHLDRRDVRVGQKVREGTVLGTTGTSGQSTGIHLHLGLRPSGGGAWQNPHAYVYTPPAGTAPAVQQPKPSKTTFQKGDAVILNGPVFRDSYGTGQGRTFMNHRGQVTIVAADLSRAAPFHVDHIGWVRITDLTRGTK